MSYAHPIGSGGQHKHWATILRVRQQKAHVWKPPYCIALLTSAFLARRLPH